MAATDQTYRNQKMLDTVFGVSCVLMLISLIWMFADDYNREWKTEQRSFRDVEEAMSERFALAKLPDPRRLEKAERDLEKAEEKLDKDRLAEIDKEIADKAAPKTKADDRARGIKAQLDSLVSFYDIAVDESGPDSTEAQQFLAQVKDLRTQLGVARAEFEKYKNEVEDLLREKARLELPKKNAERELKRLRQEFDIQAKNAQQKRWKFNDWFRALPILDAFNSPIQTSQYTLADLPIDYNFKYVTRFDRCATCHLGIDRPGYEKENLRKLAHSPTDNRLTEIQQRLDLLEMTDLEKQLKPNKKPVRLARAYQSAGSWALRDAAALLKKLGEQLDQLPPKPTPAALKPIREQIEALKKNKAIQKEIRRQNRYKDDLNTLVKKFEFKKIDLSEARIGEFSSHPRLDLFVSPTSPHSAQRFGCTICHEGLGSGTSFFYASHTPNNSAVKEKWEKEHGWKANHDWEFPMKPRRFVESNCLQCHYQVTDLIREGNRNEAPKLVRGYNLVRENGCFGCHEISGVKNGRAVGPDLRLEPIPSLDALSAAERAKATADPLNMPGAFRKVGPSLFRLSEKTHPSWVKRWIKAPRSYRPTTRMPHFYGLSTNDASVLPDDQKAFPDAEIDSIAYYLFYESQAYLVGMDTARQNAYLKVVEMFRKAKKNAKLFGLKMEILDKIDPKQLDNLAILLDQKVPVDPEMRKGWKQKALKTIKTLEKQFQLLNKVDLLLESSALNEGDKKELREAKLQLEIYLKEEKDGRPESLVEKFKQSQGSAKLPAADNEKNAALVQKGRWVFTAKGCLACHSHQAITQKEEGILPDFFEAGKFLGVKTLPGLDREKYYQDQPSFGPNLSMLKEKLGTDAAGKDDESKRRWLIQWVLNPTFHSARTLMPVTHLTFDEAASVAAWLLSKEPTESDPSWPKVKVDPAKQKVLKDLARLTLDKFMTEDEVNALFDGKVPTESVSGLPPDEHDLLRLIKADKKGLDDSLRWYVGKKAIGRQGRFGCHNIPGFDQAKTIGAALNDWGKKDPERIAFENINAFIRDNYEVVDSLTGKNGKPLPLIRDKKSGKLVTKEGAKTAYYERFFAEALSHHSREGFLYQKLKAPRSYDYTRRRPWDERLRMPLFKFARTKRRTQKESDDEFARRKLFSKEPAKLKPLAAENDAQFAARASVEEAEAREAVMTFVLGLLAEPIPDRFVYQAPPDRLAEVKGRQVLDKYNCASCHLVQPGTYNFKLADNDVMAELAKKTEKPAAERYAGDYFFANHNAWNGPPPQNDHLTVHGVPRFVYALKDSGLPNDYENAPNRAVLILAEALHFNSASHTMKQLRSSDTLGVIPKAMTERAPPLGGTFADMLVPYLIEVYKKTEGIGSDNYKENDWVRAAVPPLLWREGEKVQANWLFRFLRNPFPIRPVAKLRMPRFNMSDDEAIALVNYFASTAKVDNPGIGLTYPYLKVRQRDEDYEARSARAYAERASTYLKDQLPALLTEKQRKLEDLKAELEKAKKAEEKEKDAKKKKELAKKRGTLAAEQLKLEKDLKEWTIRKASLTAEVTQALGNEEKARDLFVTESFRLLNVCASCHRLGNTGDVKGPQLDLAEDRLRPDWTFRWLANPQRFLTYKSVMPSNFPNREKEPKDPSEREQRDKDQREFIGDPEERLQAVRDMLMNFRKVSAMPVIRNRPAAPKEGD